MENQKVRKLVLSALMAALVYVATSIIQIPSPVNGYVNLGDCFVLLSGWLLGPWYGAAAAGIGSMLVDLLSGYGHYVPGTLIIKGLDALVAALIFRALGRGKTAMLVSGIVGETIMVLGYFAYASMILGKGLAAAAVFPAISFRGSPVSPSVLRWLCCCKGKGACAERSGTVNEKIRRPCEKNSHTAPCA